MLSAGRKSGDSSSVGATSRTTATPRHNRQVQASGGTNSAKVTKEFGSRHLFTGSIRVSKVFVPYHRFDEVRCPNESPRKYV
mmetsp:Transcript_15210/g.37334  ORF Transcript_15210/g.37334 Transcript_15210/m.37334 type:complete len:82 (-) Transcript_15210:153-398(-)